LSRTAKRTACSWLCADTVTRPPLDVYLMAFPIRLAKASAMRSGSAITSPSWVWSLEPQVDALVAAAVSNARVASRTRLAASTARWLSSMRPRLDARQVEQIVDRSACRRSVSWRAAWKQVGLLLR